MGRRISRAVGYAFVFWLAGGACRPEARLESPPSFRQARGPLLGQARPGATPEVFAPGLVSGPADEAGVVVLPGGRELYYWTVEPTEEGPPRAVIHVTREGEDGWTEPEVAPFSRAFNNMYPGLQPDGMRLFFQSDRPIDAAESVYEYNLWYVQREGDGWSEARPLGRPINGKNHTGGASATRDGTVYFTLMELGGRQEIYRSRLVDGSYQEPERLPDIVNSHVQQTDSYIAPDESYLLFYAVEGDGGHGNPGGLYVAHRRGDGSWTQPVSLGALLEPGAQGGSATVSPDGAWIFFSQTLPSTTSGSDVYWVDAAALPREPPQ